MKVWLDDIRDPSNYVGDGWIWLKSWSEWVKFFSTVDNSDVECFSFDNDIAEEKEGYDAFVEVEEALHKGSFKNLKKIYVHSSNPSAVNKFILASSSLKSHFGIDMVRIQY